MAYAKQEWKNSPDETTPLSAGRLNHLETQYEEAVADSKSYTDSLVSQSAGVADLISEIRYPLYIAHRGSPLVFPEHSMEGYRGSFEAGFSPEADVEVLSDGTLVCLHDNTTNRTMDIQKPVGGVTSEEWRKASINPPSRQGGRVSGSGRGTPVFFNDYLDEFGGKIILFPEIKNVGATQAVIDAVLSRGLNRAVIVQSASFPVVQQVIQSGLEALMLGTTATPAQLQDAGCKFVSVNSSVAQTFIDDCLNRGIKVIGYTHNTVASAEAAFAKGMVGVFSDDPMLVSGDSKPKTELPGVSSGFIPWGSEHSRSSSGSANPNTSAVVEVKEGTLRFSKALDGLNGANSLRLGSFGVGSAKATLRFWVCSEGVATTANAETQWLFGVYLGSQGAGEAVNEEASTSKFRLAMVRRDGRKHVYEKRTNTGTTSQLGSTAAPSEPYAKVGGRGTPMLFEVEFSTTSVVIRNLSRNDPDLEVPNVAWTGSDHYLTLACNGSISSFWGVHCSR